MMTRSWCGSRFCDGLTRRNVLQAGLGGLAGLSLSDVLRFRAQSAARAGTTHAAANDTAIIYIVMSGGPSQFETYDPKPAALAEIRGEFAAINTNVPGVQFSELVREQARVMDKLTILRSIHHPSTQHSSSAHLIQTGYYCKPESNENEMPSIGAYASRIRGARRPGLPSYVNVPQRAQYPGADFLGHAHDPFEVNGGPNNPKFAVANLTLVEGLTTERLDDRRDLLGRLDHARRLLDQQGAADALDDFSRQAFDMVTKDAARQAFDLSAEPEKLRDRYGRNPVGQSMLMARRLVEHGVTFVTVPTVDWDNHGDLAKNMRQRVPDVDRAMAALVEDVYARGLDKQVLIVAMGEFGRAPQYAPFLNFAAGRDHWGAVSSVLMAGGGLPGGQVVGASDSRGAEPAKNPYRIECILAHMYRHLGIDPAQTFVDHNGRPRYLLEIRDRISELS